MVVVRQVQEELEEVKEALAQKDAKIEDLNETIDKLKNILAEAKEGLQKTLSDIRRSRLGRGKPVSQYLKEQGVDTQDYIQATEQLLNTPTYRFNPFSRLQ